MTENEILGLSIGGGTLLLSFVVAVVKTTRAVSKAEADIRFDMDAQIDNLQRDVAKLNDASISRTDQLRHEAGEMGSALRTKIHEVETWSRDTFVRRESFEAVVNRFEKSLEKMTDRLEAKFDKAVERFQRQD